MTEFQDKARTIINDYITSIINGEPRSSRISRAKRVQTKGYIHASNMMDCPAKAAIEQGSQSNYLRYDHLLKQNNPSMCFRMEEGNREAEIIQEAFDNGSTLLSYPEWYIESKTLKMMGTMDMWVIDRSESYIIEIKHRVKTRWGEPGPRIGDIFQMLAYQVMLEESGIKNISCNLFIISTPAWADFWNPKAYLQMWSLVPQDGGYIVINDEDQPWGDQFNDPSFINLDTLYQEIDLQHQYLEMVEAHKEIDPPIQLHQDKAWQCRTVTRKATDSTLGTFKPICPYYCHDASEDLARIYRVGEDGKWQVKW